MSVEFTYDFPDEIAFFDTLVAMLQDSDDATERVTGSLIEGGECSFSSDGQYSRRRWNAYGATVYFSLPLKTVKKLKENDEFRDVLIRNCGILMPRDAGYDVNWIEFSPMLRKVPRKADIKEVEKNEVERYIALLGHDIFPSREEVRRTEEGVELRMKRVFVIHGRNEKLRKSMFEFLRSIGLSPIEWTQAVAMTEQASPYIGDILDKAFVEAQAIIALHSPDDEGRLKEQFQEEYDEQYDKNLTPQARQNVIFETGLALGKNPERTIIVQVGNVRPYSDIAGRHVVRLDNNVKKRQAVALRLQTAGCEIDLTGTDWHDSGDFSLE